MIFSNLNIFSFLFFFIFLGFFVFIFARKKIFDLKIFSLVIAFFIILFSVFWLKIKTENSERIIWNEILFVLDLSKSMETKDILKDKNLVSRLNFSKEIIEKIILENKNNNFWLVVFAWETKSILPFTSDFELFLESLKWLNYLYFSEQWSNFKDALKVTENRLLFAENKEKLVIFLSDWWEEKNFSENDIEKNFSKNSKYIFLWVWTEIWWKVLLGEEVSKINEKNLLWLTKITNWEYFRVEKFEDLEKISEKVKKLNQQILIENKNFLMKNFSRNLAFFSFVFFIFFVLFYIFKENEK